MTRVLAVAASAAALCAAGCGAGDSPAGDPDAALRDTAARLSEIRSGTLGFRLSIDPKGRDAERLGWELDGPFALGGDGKPARFQVAYTQRRGDHEATVTVTSTGERAYVSIGNEAYEVPADQARDLLQAGTAVAGEQGLGTLDVGAWLRDPELSDGEEVGGDPTDRIRADLDVAAAVRDVVELMRRAGGGSLGSLSEADGRRLADAADRATLELLTGKDDRLLRRLDLEFDVGFNAPEGLSPVLGDVVGAEVDLEVTVEHPNEPVSIEAPADAHPPSEFPG